MKILVIEDEVELSKSICKYLESENFFCETAYTYETAMEKVSFYDYACILLDIGLPGGSGLEILQYLKAENKNEGVLIVSAKNSLDDKVAGLRSGADDYLTKPFHLPELSARVAAIIRRKSFEGRNIIIADNLELDLNNKTATVSQNLVDLTRKEYDLLLYLISNKNRVISKNAIAEHLWGDNMDLAKNYDFIYTHVKNLRKKLSLAGCELPIKSIYGLGYKFEGS